MFRRFASSPSGDAFTPAAEGQSVKHSWTYDLDLAEWDTTKVYAVVWVQLESTKEVINAGAQHLPQVELVTDDQQFKKGAPQQQTTFAARIENLGEAPASVRLEWAQKLSHWPQQIADELEGQGYPAIAILNATLDAAEEVGYEWPVRYEVK